MERFIRTIDQSEDQKDVIAFLSEDAEHIETHAAHVFLKGHIAFKLKKAVCLPYLDFSTCALRKGALEHELRINQAFAPDLYLDVQPIIRAGAGKLRMGGRGRDIDWVLRMKRFPPRGLLSDLIRDGNLDDRLVLSLAAVIADAHAKAAIREWDGVGIMAALETQLFRALTTETSLIGSDTAGRFRKLYADRFRHAKALLAARGKAGSVRHCHGDLHCRNIVVIDGKPILFDAIEFSERIAT
jgi:uncharacterized protein